jgi:hypothetical protein
MVAVTLEELRSAGWEGLRGMGGAEGAGVLRALRMTARTTAGRTDNGKNRSRSPSGMTTKKNNGKNKQWLYLPWLKQYVDTPYEGT